MLLKVENEEIGKYLTKFSEGQKKKKIVAH